MEKYIVKSEEEIKIIFNTYRMKIIEQFSKMENMTATFKQIADTLGDNSSKVTYHGKMLIDIGLLELSHTKSINGITAKYYKLLTENFEIAKDTPVYDMAQTMLKSQVSRTMMGFFEDMQQKLASATKFDDKYSIHMSSDELYLTKEEIDDLVEIMHTYNDKKTPRPNTKKVDVMSIVMCKDDDNMVDDV